MTIIFFAPQRAALQRLREGALRLPPGLQRVQRNLGQLAIIWAARARDPAQCRLPWRPISPEPTGLPRQRRLPIPGDYALAGSRSPLACTPPRGCARK